jgi:hypothetical protein
MPPLRFGQIPGHRFVSDSSAEIPAENSADMDSETDMDRTD